MDGDVDNSGATMVTRDTERLDWLEKSCRGMEYLTADDQDGEPTRHFWMVDGALPSQYRITLREAIDAAMLQCDGCEGTGHLGIHGVEGVCGMCDGSGRGVEPAP